MLAAIKSKASSFTFPKIKLPRITMPWERSINELKKKVCELEFELGVYAEHLQELGESVDEKFDNCQFVNRDEVESMIECSVEGGVEDAMTSFVDGCDYLNSDEIDNAISQSFKDASFEVCVRV